jgi:hypothetical protein
LRAPRSRQSACRLCFATLLSLSLVLALAGSAWAEKILLKADGWEVFADGRVGGFVSQVNGDGDPVGSPGTNVVTYPDGMMVRDTPQGGGWSAATTNGNTSANPPVQGTVNQTRIRSGFLGNQFNFGVRGQVTPYTTITGYISIWAFIESISQSKSNPNPADVRQGYAKLEGPWGSLLAGRTRTLFSRGATDIDVLYAHKWGVGFPGATAIDSNGPTAGQVGFGVMGSGFAAAMIYGTPVLGGFHLNIGAFDPATLSGTGLTRTGYPRAEAELTGEWTLGQIGKVVVFVNGLYQNVYKDGTCDPATNGGPCETTSVGVGYGGRLELGPVHIGLAGDYGQGLGLGYALENSAGAFDIQGNPRTVDGYYAQSQFVLGRFDLFAGWGITRIFLTTLDKAAPSGTDPSPNSVIKYQMGTNAGVVFNMTPNVHFDLEYFRAQAAWWLGEKQVLNTGDFGMTFNW